jgi:hypothetical protein
MKTQTLELTKDIFSTFALHNEEMINVRGGNSEGEPIVLPTPPPIVI